MVALIHCLNSFSEHHSSISALCCQERLHWRKIGCRYFLQIIPSLLDPILTMNDMLPGIIFRLHVVAMICQGCPVRAAGLKWWFLHWPFMWPFRNVLHHYILWSESPIIVENLCEVTKGPSCLRLLAIALPRASS